MRIFIRGFKKLLGSDFFFLNFIGYVVGVIDIDIYISTERK
jgi:hypothetical protein